MVNSGNERNPYHQLNLDDEASEKELVWGYDKPS